MRQSETFDAERLFQEALAMHRGGRLQQAIATYRRVTEINPGHVGALCNLGIALRKAGRAGDAIDCYRRALAIAPERTEIHTNLGIVLAVLGQYGPAIEAFQQALALNPELADVHVHIGNALCGLGQKEAAVDSYRRAAKARPDHTGVLMNLGVTLQEIGRLEEAARVFEDALARDPGLVSAIGHLASVYAALRRDEEAVAIARRGLALEPANREALAGLSAALRSPDRVAELASAYQAAIAAQPGESHAAVALAELYLKQGDPAAALRVVDECLMRLPRDIWCLALETTLLNELGDKARLDRLADYDRLVQTKLWDAVPEFGSLDRLNAALIQHVLSHPSLVHQPKATATREGRHTGNLLLPPIGPMGALESMILSMVDDYVQRVAQHGGNPLLAHPPARWRLVIWAVVMEERGHQIPHVHPSAWLSGVYYPKVPGSVQAPKGAADLTGCLEFGRPLERHKTTAPPRLRTVRPAEGLMVMFPPYFLHSTVPLESNEMRISIAFDVTPVL